MELLFSIICLTSKYFATKLNLLTYSRIKGIVSRDWGGLQMRSFDRMEVFLCFLFKFIFIFVGIFIKSLVWHSCVASSKCIRNKGELDNKLKRFILSKNHLINFARLFCYTVAVHICPPMFLFPCPFCVSLCPLSSVAFLCSYLDTISFW